MALKDLIVSHDELTEQQIEDLIAPYVRFDPTSKSIVLLPTAAALSNRQRVIAYLIALRGWPFVLPDDPPPTSCAPAELEAALQIAGGTLRPILKELKDSRMIQASEGRYSANPVTFPFLRQQLEIDASPGTATGSRTVRKAKKSTKSTRKKTTSDPEAPTPADVKKQLPTPEGTTQRKRRTRRDATVSGAGPKARVQALIKEGWFATPRSVREIVAELANRGATYRGQDLTRQLQGLVRARELRREKTKRNGGRAVWCYSEP